MLSTVILGMRHALEEGELGEAAHALHFLVIVLEVKQFFPLDMFLSSLLCSLLFENFLNFKTQLK